ncbi:MAG: hypothetical protein LH624_17110 [Cryobacterium sp.]|nr:hypothetical protein [Cryobacterium sp.]
MPTFQDAAADSEEARQALRGLADATRFFETPEDTYAVIGDLLDSVGSLRQVLDHLATAHLAHRNFARDDNGDVVTGARSAEAAAEELRQAAVLVDQLGSRLESASQLSGRIAWGPAPRTESESRWVSVVFLQSEDADEVLDIVDSAGTDAAIEHLCGYDFGEETTQAALVNGYVYETPPVGELDRTAPSNAYSLTYNPFLGNVGLFREYTVPLDPELHGVGTAGITPARVGQDSRRTAARPALADSAGLGWFGRPRAAASASRGLSL